MSLTPEQKIISFENLSLPECYNLPPSISMLRRMFTLLLQEHYSSPNNYGYLREYLECLHFDQDGDGKNDSTLLVKPVHSEDLDDATEPAVYVSIENIDFRTAALTQADLHSEDNATASRTYKCTSQLVVTHLHSVYDVAYSMAESTCVFITAIYPLYEPKLSVLPQRISKPELREKNPKVYQSLFIATIAFEFTVNTTTESLRLKKYALEVEPATC